MIVGILFRVGGKSLRRSGQLVPNMMCPYCNCELSDLFPFSFCPTCGQPIESRHTGQGVVRENLRGSDGGSDSRF